MALSTQQRMQDRPSLQALCQYMELTASVTGAKQTWRHDQASACVPAGLDPKEGERPEFALVFSGNVPLPGTKGKSYAQCYGGHQFGNWAGTEQELPAALAFTPPAWTIPLPSSYDFHPGPLGIAGILCRQMYAPLRLRTHHTCLIHKGTPVLDKPLFHLPPPP